MQRARDRFGRRTASVPGDAAGRPAAQLRGTLGLVLVLAAAAGVSLRAEVAAQPGPDGVGVVILGVIEGPDPIPQIIWDPIRDVDPVLFLNPEGAERGDGRPDYSIDPLTKWPHVVWAYKRGTHHDIAYSRWDGSGWTPTSFLTTGSVNEVDPRVFVDAAAIHVVWWEPVTKALRLTKRPRTGSWGLTETVGGAAGMRPSVATWGGTVLVASERSNAVGGKTIHLSTRISPNNFSTVALFSAPPQSQPLDVVLHVEQGKLWMDWRHSPTKFAYSVQQGWSWSPLVTLSWTDPSWMSFLQARLLIRGLVLSGP